MGKGKDKKIKLSNRDLNILNEWEKSWDTDSCKVNFDNDLKNRLAAVYRETGNKMAYNRNMNFNFKKAFIITQIVFFILYLGFLVYGKIKGIKSMSFINATLFYAVVIFFSSIISKWTDIKKYQETWARHQKLFFMLQKEMMFYCYRIAPYDKDDRKSTFFINVMKHQEDNINKFCDNMDNKEKGLMDFYSNLAIKK